MCFSCILSKPFKGGFVPLHSVWTGIFGAWVNEQPDPSLSPGNVPSPGLPWWGSHGASYFVSCDTVWKWSKNRHAAASKHFSSRCAAATVSIFPSCNHMCTTGNNRVLCCSFMAERMFLNPAVCTAVLHCWTETEGRECVREREGGFEGWSHRAYFGFSDDSPAGCGLWCGCPMWGKPLSSSVLGQLLAFGQFSKHS